ncbi:phosphodiester glycosidase family protein, partial [bacterium]|nr:phosphodiester glycosidase family protein [bacterium]
MKKNRSKTLIYLLMLFLLPASVCNAKAIYRTETIYIPSPVTMHILSFGKDDFFISVHTVEDPYVKELSSIVESSGALFGLNGGFFGRENNEILGLLSSNGKIISKKRLFGRGSLIVGNDNSIRIDMLSREDLTGEIALEERFVLSGGHIILRDSKVSELKSKKNPMTAVGYNADRIYLVVADGRNLTSWGIDEKRLGAYMREIGCTHA